MCKKPSANPPNSVPRITTPPENSGVAPAAVGTSSWRKGATSGPLGPSERF